MLLALVIYATLALLIFLYIVFSAVFWDGRHDKLIPYYFGVQLDLSGWRGLLFQAFIFALFWLPLLLWAAYAYFRNR